MRAEAGHASRKGAGQGVRPPRTHYTITGAAASSARIQLAELSERYRPPALGRLRPQGGTA
jgi:hypothetical protein